ncbi:MAG: DUF1707 SHOCT-like domain-containing protein [Solirubrobacteraceae bacterium]
MSTLPPARLASEDVIINAPMSYTGSAQRILRIRRGAQGGSAMVRITVATTLLVLVAWVVITGWYLLWGIWLVPYRLLRRGARKRKAEAIRHRELMGTIQGSAAASAAAIVAGRVSPTPRGELATIHPLNQRIGDLDRERAIEDLREHMLAGRLTAEEFDQRLGLAHAARTWGDLQACCADLPAVQAGPSRPG